MFYSLKIERNVWCLGVKIGSGSLIAPYFSQMKEVILFHVKKKCDKVIRRYHSTTLSLFYSFLVGRGPI